MLVKKCLVHESPPTFGQSFRPPVEVQGEAQPRKVHILSYFRKIFRISSHSMGHRSRPRLDIRHLKHEVAYICERGPDDERASHCSELIH